MSELLTVVETWIYKYEPQRRVNNKQWLCKEQARPAIIVEEQKVQEKFHKPYMNSDWPMFKFKCQSTKSYSKVI